MDAAAQAGAYGRYPPRPPPYIQTPYNAQPIPTSTDKMNENQAAAAAYLAQQQREQVINVSQLEQQMNAYGQSPSGGNQMYVVAAAAAAMKYNSQPSTPTQPYSGNTTPTGQQPNQAYYGGPPSQSMQQNTAYPQDSPVNSQFNFGQ